MFFLWKLHQNEMRYVKISIIINISGNITCCQPGYLSIVAELCTKESLSYVPLNVDDLLAFLLTWEHLNNRSWDSSVSIVTRLRDGRSGVRITIGAKQFSLLQKPPERKWGPPPTGGSFSGVKRPGREANHSPQSRVEVKNEWSCTSSAHTPSWCGQGKPFTLM
jgi:hypothetical protein